MIEGDNGVVERLADFLSQEFPDGITRLVPPEDPRMIICDIDSDEESSVSIAYIQRLEPHYHSESKVVLIVEEGELLTQVAARQRELSEGEAIEIEPGKVHSASADWARVRIESIPGWQENDHIFTSRR